MEKIDYQFVAVPLNLFCRLDNNLRSMLFTLIQLQTYYAEEDGWFYRSNADLGAQSNLSENLVRITIDVLYNAGLIDVESVGKGRGTNSPSNRFKVNWERFKDYEKDDIEKCIKDPRLAIVTPKYKGSHYHPSYLDKNNSGSEPHDKAEGEDKVDCGVMVADTNLVEDEVDSKVNNLVTDVVKVEDNIYNINNLNNNDNINNIDNINNKENIEINNTCNNTIYNNIDDYSINLDSYFVYSDIQTYDVIQVKSQLNEMINNIKHVEDEKQYLPTLYKILDYINEHKNYIRSWKVEELKEKVQDVMTFRYREIEENRKTHQPA